AIIAGVLILTISAQTHAEAISEDSLLALYQQLHANPELSFQEKQTATRIARELRDAGFRVTEGIGGYGLVAVLENGPGPTLMLRADMDALPVKEQTGLPYSSTATATLDDGSRVPVMHACGHDIHMTVLVGTARNLAARRATWRGTLLLVVEPAEERGAGARLMLADGLFERFPRPDYNLALHANAELPAGTIGYTRGYAMANVDSVDINVRGIGGHGAYPHKTRDPVVLAAQLVLQLQTIVSREISPLESAVITVGSIHGGSKHNIIGDSVKLQLTVRSYSDETRDLLLRRIREMSLGLARTAGLPEELLPVVEIKEEYTPSVFNDPELTGRVVSVLSSELGENQVQALPPAMAGEDFARYGRTEPRIPSVLFWLGAVDPELYAAAKEKGESLPALHSPRFAPLAQPAIETGVRAFTALAQDLLGPE
ncbi:MAG: amidohydrolase, partial [Pseudomonadota bacterium]